MSLSNTVRLSVIVKQKNGGTQHSASFVLNCMSQLLQRFTTNSSVYCCAWGKNCTKRTPCLSQNTVHMIFLVEIVCLNEMWTPTSCLIVHVLSSFIEHPNPFSNHAITHRIVTIHLKGLVMNLTWKHIPGFLKTNYRPYFTVGGPFNCLKHVYHTEKKHKHKRNSTKWRLWLLN